MSHCYACFLQEHPNNLCGREGLRRVYSLCIRSRNRWDVWVNFTHGDLQFVRCLPDSATYTSAILISEFGGFCSLGHFDSCG